MESDNYSEKNNMITINQIVSDHQISLTEDDIFNFLKITNRWPPKYYHWDQPSIQVISEQGMVSSTFYSLEGKFLYDEWKKLYDAGFTTILTQVLDLSPELRSLSDKIFNFFGENINGNFYFSKGSKDHRVSFSKHKHDYSVIVKPIYGKSKWIVDKKVFYPEKAFIIPSGTGHCVCESFEKKLSLTLNFQSFHPGDFRKSNFNIKYG